MVQINNFQDHPYTLKRAIHRANSSIPTPNQMKHIQPIDPAPIRRLLHNNHDNVLQYVNSLRKNPRSHVSVETYWLPTPQNPGTPSDQTPMQKRILTELNALEDLEKLKTQASHKSPDQFSSNFDWTDSTLYQQTKASIEALLVQFNDISAWFRFDIGNKKYFQVVLTPIDDRAV